MRKESWVDYRELKSRVSLEMVLRRYGVFEGLTVSGKNLVGCCPIHKGSNPRQFSVNLRKNVYNCFGNCKSGGNIFDFVSKMEGVGVRDAALLIQGWFPADGSAGPRDAPERRDDAGCESPAKASETGESGMEKLENPPLTFELKNLSGDHPFLAERGISPETASLFGLGYCTRGMLAGRIAIPIRDEAGALVAYCGRAVSKGQAEAEGKYKLPPKFHKSLVAYNLHRIPPGTGTVILAESYLSVWRLHAAGYGNAVSLMGSKLSERQAELVASLVGPLGRALLMLDADEDGRACADQCLRILGRSCFVKALDVSPYARKPHLMSPEELRELLDPYLEEGGRHGDQDPGAMADAGV